MSSEVLVSVLFFSCLVGALAAPSPAGVLLPPLWSARPQQAAEAGPASAGDLPVQRPPSGKSPLLSSPLIPSPLISSPLLNVFSIRVISGNQDFPEKEELCDLQLQAVFLAVWDASHAVWKSV